jgi:hypothetical protein
VGHIRKFISGKKLGDRMAKTKRRWIQLDFSNADSLRAQDIPYDASRSIKDVIDTSLGISGYSGFGISGYSGVPGAVAGSGYSGASGFSGYSGL